MRVRVTASRLCRASMATLWSILDEMENWPQWADPASKTHLIRHHVVERNGNTVVCEEEEIAGGFRVRHRDRYTLHPKDRIVEEILDGSVSGGYDLRLTDTIDGTKIDWEFDLKPETVKFWLVGLFAGRRVIQGIADEYCRQLAEFAEVRERAGEQREELPA